MLVRLGAIKCSSCLWEILQLFIYKYLAVEIRNGIAYTITLRKNEPYTCIFAHILQAVCWELVVKRHIGCSHFHDS